MPCIAHHDGQCPGEQSVVRVNADASQGNARLLGNDGGDVGHDTDVIMPYDTQGDGVLCALRLSGPACLHDAVTET